jgi:pimeloyl-ACP methyl ester carboxylesterase
MAIDIGGRHLNLVCDGQGSPTVVFLQGLGGGITAWDRVRNPVSALARACFYDRAGFGYSDPATQPSTADNETNDLHALLRRAGIKGPIILMGHSLGGLYATLYADKFPDEVGGLVLVDPSFAGQFDYDLPRARRLMRSDEDRFVTFLKNCQSLARGGSLSRERSENCFFLPTNPTPQQADYFLFQGTRPSYYAAGVSEIESFFPLTRKASLDGSQEFAKRRDFGAMPLVVLNAGARHRDSRLSDSDNEAMAAFLLQGHEALATRSSRGQLVVVPQSGHDIQADNPEAVVGAVRKVLLESRQAKRR